MTPTDIRKLADAHEALDNMKDARAFRALADVVEAGKCKNCGGIGYTTIGRGTEWEQEQCQWCFENHELCQALARVEALKP